MYSAPLVYLPSFIANLAYRQNSRLSRYPPLMYWSVIMECQDWSSDTIIDLIVEGRNRWVVLIRILTCIYFSSDYF
jgi:hypothetical protein